MGWKMQNREGLMWLTDVKKVECDREVSDMCVSDVR